MLRPADLASLQPELPENSGIGGGGIQKSGLASWIVAVIVAVVVILVIVVIFIRYRNLSLFMALSTTTFFVKGKLFTVENNSRAQRNIFGCNANKILLRKYRQRPL